MGELWTWTVTYPGVKPCEHEGRDRDNASTCSGRPSIASKPLEAGRGAQEDFPSHPSEGTNLTYILISDFWLPEL